MNAMTNWSAPRQARPRTMERFTDPLQIYFQPSQKTALESWLRREKPGTKVGTFIRDAALAAMEADAPSSVVLHLGDEERAAIMDVAREMGHRDLGIFIEEFMLRVSKRPAAEVIAFFLNASAPVAGTDSSRQQRFEDEMRRVIEARGGEESGDQGTRAA